MISEPETTTATNSGPGQSVIVRLVGYDKPLVTALAVAIALVSLLAVFLQSRHIDALDTDARLTAYWCERAEVAMTAGGIAVPPPPAIPQPKGK